MNKIGIFAIVVFLLCGCGVYTRYQRPDVPVENLYRNVSASGDTTSVGQKSWRELFTDTRLQTLIAEGLEKNTDLQVAKLQAEEAQAVLLNARLAYLPAVNLNPQAGISHYDGCTKKTYNLGATATWDLEVSGKQTNAKRGAKAALEGEQAYVQAVQTQLVATIAESYYTLLMLDAQLQIAGETLENWNETVATLEALMEAGKANDVAVLQARANRTALEASVKTLRRSVSETENALSSLLRRTSQPVERGKLESQAFAEKPAAGLPVSLLSARPDVHQAEAALAEAFYATNSARSSFYPSLTLSGSLGWTNNGGGSITNPGKWLSSALAQLTAPLFNRGTNIANLKIAKARQQEALLRFEQSLLDAGQEVNDALTEWQTADERIALDRKQIYLLQETVEKTRLLVRYSSANYLEVLTAQQALLNARLTLVQDQTARVKGTIHLYRALGGGAE